jgi:hypothetical protein
VAVDSEFVETSARQITTASVSPASQLPQLVARKAIRWIYGNLGYFNPFAESRLSDDFRHKAFAELALLCLILRRHALLGSLPEIREIITFASKLNDNPFFEASLCRWNDALIPVLMLSVTLDAYGISPGGRRREMIQNVVQESNACVIERVPYRQLELRHILDVGGFDHNLPSYKELWSLTLLANRPNLMFLSNNDIYSITHALFYVTDFAVQKIGFLGALDIGVIHSTICHLLGVCIRRENWDLTAELLVAEKCLGRTSRYSVIGWRYLWESQETDGRVEGPQSAHPANEVRDGESVFEACYHTTLVAAIAGAVWSRGI